MNAYERLLVGLFQIHKGPANALLKPRNMPKVTELVAGYTRDGFHWHRPVRTPFIAASRRPGTLSVTICGTKDFHGGRSRPSVAIAP